ncbi:hypothetical protein ALC57_12563, partial [Trachymyrmex cornetzi]
LILSTTVISDGIAERRHSKSLLLHNVLKATPCDKSLLVPNGAVHSGMPTTSRQYPTDAVQFYINLADEPQPRLPVDVWCQSAQVAVLSKYSCWSLACSSIETLFPSTGSCPGGCREVVRKYKMSWSSARPPRYSKMNKNMRYAITSVYHINTFYMHTSSGRNSKISIFR